MKIITVVGARPNFIKIAPFVKAIEFHNNNHSDKIIHIITHTGQHYDDFLSNSFFKELNIPEADINLEIGSGSHAEQVGKTMIEFEKVLKKYIPDWVVVVGDVNATLACSVTAKKENIKCCHIEAGLRSGDMTMPEEINRIVTDRISDLLLTPDRISSENLRKEGIPEGRIKFVGNIMIDTLKEQLKKTMELNIQKVILDNLIEEHQELPDLKNIKKYAVLTLHRPSNVDEKNIFEPIIEFLLNEIATDTILLWPVHPRAYKQLLHFNLWDKIKNAENLILMHPLGYREMLRLNMNARIIITDSGGLQEECTILKIPCLTLRWNTERPVTLMENGGVSILVGNKIENIKREYKIILKKELKVTLPELWDGHTADRCLREILNY
jgi:UDP-N-acetylglucosamine 2-epimerase (non-hydrolysing)